jgi:SAM-dependent methyltransferase
MSYTKEEELFITQTDRLGTLIDPYLVAAFAHLERYMNVSEARVLSLRCGAGRSYDRITSYLKTPENYWGVVGTPEQAETAKKRYPLASFHVSEHEGNYTNIADVVNSADIIFTALSYTFHSDAAGLFRDIYSMMAPNAWFIIIEARDLVERDAALQLKYPSIDPRFFRLRQEVIKGQKGDTDVAMSLPEIFKKYEINPLHKTVTDSYEPGDLALKRMISLTTQLGQKLIEQQNPIIGSQKDIDDIIGTIEKTQPNDFIYIGEIHIYIGRKH